MIRSRDVQDRLYLSQGEHNIYIDNCRIPQHHIEGIRFLYKQYRRGCICTEFEIKTKCPNMPAMAAGYVIKYSCFSFQYRKGVIINDPFSCGRNIQIILFLKAVRPLLKKSVLILCQEGGEQDWIERFHTWTDLYDDVAIESTNPTFKKLVTINAMVNLPVFCDREWSIVIVDGENNTPTSLILKLPFKADFKIWNTSINMNKNLDKFAEIYKWLFPNELFDKHYFIPNSKSAVDIIDKAILLDSFMEDIVLRRDDLDSSFENYHRDIMPPPKTTTATTTATITATTTTISRKNKDAAGTKIKRSKTKTIVEESQNKPATAALTTLIGETSKSSETFDSTEDFSIDNYKKKIMKDSRNVNEENKPPFKIIEIGNTEEQSDLKLYFEADSLRGTMIKKLEEMDTLVFGHDTFISKVSPKRNIEEFACDKEGTEPVVVLTTTSKTIEDNDNSKSDTTKKCSGNNSMNLNETEGYKKNESISNKTKANLGKDIGNSDITDKRLTRQKDSDFNKMILDELNKGISDLGTKDYSEEDTKQKNITGRHNDEIKVNTNEINKNLNKSDTGQNSLKRNNIDDKMKEYEEKVSKKFKGSLLDSLF